MMESLLADLLVIRFPRIKICSDLISYLSDCLLSFTQTTNTALYRQE